MKTKQELEALTYSEFVEEMASLGVIIEFTTNEEIHEFYRNRLLPMKYDKMVAVIDGSNWTYKITTTDGKSISFCNDSRLVDFSMQAIPVEVVEHK